MLSGKRPLLRLAAIRFFSRRSAPASICSGITKPAARSSRSRCMSWRDAQTLTLYRADAVPASRRGDRMVMVLACILIAVGIGMIYSGSAVMAQKRFGDSAYFLKRQLLWLAVGMVFLLVFARTDLKTLRSWGVPFLLIGLVALVAVLLPMIGVTVKGARRWLRFGVWTIQPAELVKIAVLLYLAHYMAKNGERIEDFRGFIRPLLMVGLVLGLIVVDPDLGTAAVIGLVTLSLLLIGGPRRGRLSMRGLAALPALSPRLAGVSDRRL